MMGGGGSVSFHFYLISFFKKAFNARQGQSRRIVYSHIYVIFYFFWPTLRNLFFFGCVLNKLNRKTTFCFF